MRPVGHQGGRYQVIIAGNQPRRAYDAMAMDLPADSVHTSDGWGVSKPEAGFFAKVAAVAGPRAGSSTWGTGSTTTCSRRPRRACTALLRRGPWGYLHADRPEAQAADVLADDLHALLPALARLT
ncbi:hypothetical protein [[Actinomadura] parvosata]|uniref:hypothetical protein n=1 Tax=[Actinomadura] parvosata TaxID=1955412 RepID=UPI002E2FC2C8|nr:hypothetical protein [Nonomuraea sp. ATCC 55076]